MVMKNKEILSKYLDWQKHYFSFDPHPYEFCELCRKMQGISKKYQRLYRTIGDFLNGGTYENYCKEPNDID